jgi:hypothetical protein
LSLAARPLKQYHIFLASPGDVGPERQHVRQFFDEYNRHTAQIWRARFEVIGWDTDSTTGVGRPQELINQSTLEKYRGSLALVIGIMAQRFGTPSGKAESGTKEEFDVAMASHKETGFPEIKWFFRTVDKLELPPNIEQATAALAQWQQVLAFRHAMQDLNNPVFYTEYPGAAGFAKVFDRDLNLWLADSARPWAAELAAAGGAAAPVLPTEFNAEHYQGTLLKRFDNLNFEMLDTTGAFYSNVRLWSVFIPQSVRECHQYNPRLLEIPKEHQQRLLAEGDITAKELAEAESHADRQRQEYFSQPLQPVLDIVDEALAAMSSRAGQKVVILGDPGSGKSSLIRYLALRWARIAESTVRDAQPVPLVIDLREYGRWECEGRKGFVRFLEEGPVWHEWPRGLLHRLLEQSGQLVLLLDGLDEVFDVRAREAVINDIQRFSSEFSHTPILVTSRVVGYQRQRLRDADFRHFMLQDLDADQIDAFADRWHSETFDSEEMAAPKRERLKKAINDSKAIAMLAGNPLLLTMMAILNRNQELPRDRVELYSQASRVLLHQWDTERALMDFPGLRADIGLREKTEILRRVASHMQADPGGLKGNLIDGATLTTLIEAYLRDELHFDQSRDAARAVVEHLRQRNFILCFVGTDRYAFVHRTFLEYFCAAEIVHQFNVTKILDNDALSALFDDHCRHDEWREVLRLICGQIDETLVGKIVERLATRTDLENWDCEIPLPQLPLAIECLAEVRSPAKIASAADVLLQSVIRCASVEEGSPRLQGFLRERILPASKGLGGKWPPSMPLSDRAFEIADSMTGCGREFWPEFLANVDPNRSVVKEFLRHKRWEFRSSACRALAEKWPDDATRALLAELAVKDDNFGPRRAALELLAEKWPDETTRGLLAERAARDENVAPRRAALELLTEKWPDEKTRALLAERAVQDADYDPRRAALRLLAEKWRDEETRALLAERAVQDADYDLRRAALRLLAEKWPDEMTRALLAELAVQDADYDPRSAALRLLAEKWPDEKTRALLAERAVQDARRFSRSTALQFSAEKWPDEKTRALLAECAVQDAADSPRRAALRSLAEKWPDRSTRALLSERATQDARYATRRAALQLLAEKWPDEATRALLAERADQDENAAPRRARVVG